MASALLELSEVLRSKTDEDKMTTSESMLIGNCMAKSVKNSFVGAFVSSAVVYRATRKLGRLYSFYLSAGRNWAGGASWQANINCLLSQKPPPFISSAMLVGKLVVDRSANACLEHILSVEGSRMQRELANIILWKHRESPSRMQLVRKHFYPEIAFTDLKPDEPLLRWRTRNAYEDGAEDDGNCGNYTDVKTPPSGQSKGNLGPVKAFQSNQGADLLADPLDCIVFGNQESSDEIRHVDGAEFPRSRRSARRRARRHDRDRRAETYSHSTKR